MTRPNPVVGAPVIGLAPGLGKGRVWINRPYVDAIVRAGGLPIILPPCPDRVEHLLSLCDGLVLPGGDDPRMEEWNRPTHPQATLVEPERQVFDLAVLRGARDRDLPVLGICLGMQYLGLEAGGELDQHLPDTLPSADLHAGGCQHSVEGTLGSGDVHSRHHQALSTPGSFEITCRASDGVIEAIADPAARWCVGVQWHPERTGPGPLGDDLFSDLVRASMLTERSHVAQHATG